MLLHKQTSTEKMEWLTDRERRFDEYVRKKDIKMEFFYKFKKCCVHIRQTIDVFLIKL